VGTQPNGGEEPKVSERGKERQRKKAGSRNGEQNHYWFKRLGKTKNHKTKKKAQRRRTACGPRGKKKKNPQKKKQDRGLPKTSGPTRKFRTEGGKQKKPPQ